MESSLLYSDSLDFNMIQLCLIKVSFSRTVSVGFVNRFYEMISFNLFRRNDVKNIAKQANKKLITLQ